MKQILFFTTLFVMLYTKTIFWLSIFIVILWFISIKQAFKFTKKVIKSIFLFNFSVSLGYFIMAIYRDLPLDYLIYINLKVFLMTYFVFWFFSKNNIVQFFSFSKNLSFLLTITLSQIQSYKKTFEDFSLSYKARVIKKLRKRKEHFIQNTFDFFLKKALKDSKERSLSLKARGFFD